MAHINYELPDDLHRALKVRAAEEGVTLKELILRTLAAATGPTGPTGPGAHGDQ